MENSESTTVVQSPPSMAWAWFHSGAIDLVFSVVYFIIGLIYLAGLKPFSTWQKSLSSTTETILFIAAIAIFMVLFMVSRFKITAMLRRRVAKENQKPALADNISQGLRYLIVLGMFGAMLMHFPEQQVFVTFILLLLLLASVTAIRVKYHYFWFILIIGCVLLVRSFLKDTLVVFLGGSPYHICARFLLVGAILGVASLLRLKSFIKRYPVIE